MQQIWTTVLSMAVTKGKWYCEEVISGSGYTNALGTIHFMPWTEIKLILIGI